MIVAEASHDHPSFKLTSRKEMASKRHTWDDIAPHLFHREHSSERHDKMRENRLNGNSSGRFAGSVHCLGPLDTCLGGLGLAPSVHVVCLSAVSMKASFAIEGLHPKSASGRDDLVRSGLGRSLSAPNGTPELLQNTWWHEQPHMSGFRMEPFRFMHNPRPSPLCTKPLTMSSPVIHLLPHFSGISIGPSAHGWNQEQESKRPRAPTLLFMLHGLPLLLWLFRNAIAVERTCPQNTVHTV